MEIKNYSSYAIQCAIDYRLSFGNDIIISDYNTHSNYGESSLGSYYKYNHDVDAVYDPNEFLAESQRFQVKQIEVFKEME